MGTADRTQEITNHVTEGLQLLEAGNDTALTIFLESLHPAELVSVIGSVESNVRLDLIKHITGLDKLSELIAHADAQLMPQVLEMLDNVRIAAVIRRQEMDDAADTLGVLPRRRQLSILRHLSPETVKDLTSLLAYDQQTAGGIMTTLYVSFHAEQTASEALRDLKNRLMSKEISSDVDLSYLYITNNNHCLLGVSSLRELFTAKPDTQLSELIELGNTELVSVHPDDDQEHVANLIRDYDFRALPVISEGEGKMLGIVTVDDILDVIEEEHTEDLLKLAGTEDNDVVGASIRTAIRSRLPWLLASWGGGIGGALLIENFSTTLEKIVALAFFMPVVFGMGGNIGSQATTITVRGIATGMLGPYNASRRVRKEAVVGLSLGIVFGVLLGIATFLLYNDIALSGIVGVSIFATMTCAATLGALLPILLERSGIDPAVASGPFVTTGTDILSILIYFSVASFFF